MGVLEARGGSRAYLGGVVGESWAIIDAGEPLGRGSWGYFGGLLESSGGSWEFVMRRQHAK